MITDTRLTPMQNFRWGDLRATGAVARPDTIARVSRSRVDGGAAGGMAIIHVAMSGGFALRILPDRGLDISDATATGIPIGWMSKAGEMTPLDRADGKTWIERFTGGVLTTYGPDNIGLPSIDDNMALGLHGSWPLVDAQPVALEGAHEI